MDTVWTKEVKAYKKDKGCRGGGNIGCGRGGGSKGGGWGRGEGG